MFSGWSSFFTLTGSAGAGLIGLLFVVVTLGVDLSTSRRLDVARALMTPALISFADVLLQGMIVLAPWPSDRPTGFLFLALEAWYTESTRSVCGSIKSVSRPSTDRSTGPSTTRFPSSAASVCLPAARD